MAIRRKKSLPIQYTFIRCDLFMVEIIEKTPMSVVELKKELAAIEKRDGELNFRAQRTQEYAKELVMLTQKDHDELLKKLRELDLPRLKEEHMRKIADLLPQNEKHLKVILSGYALTVSADNMKKIVAVLKEYKPKK